MVDYDRAKTIAARVISKQTVPWACLCWITRIAQSRLKIRFAWPRNLVKHLDFHVDEGLHPGQMDWTLSRKPH